MSVTRRQENDSYVLQTRVGLHDSALRDGTVAREVVKMMLLPEDVEEQKKQSVGDVMHGVWPHFVHLAHDITTLRAAVHRHSDISANLQNQLREANDKLAGSDRRLRQLADREANLAGDLKKEKEEKRKLEEANKALQEAIAGKEANLKELRGVAADRAAKLEQCQKVADLAIDRTRAAEGRVAAAEEDRARAIAAANRAIEDYKGSDNFSRDAATACIDLYKYGFSACLAKVSEAFPGLDLQKFALPADEEEGEAQGPSEGDGTGGDALAPVVVDSPDPPPAEK